MEQSVETFTEVSLTEDGDLFIRISDTSDQNQDKEFLVDSHVVSRSSEKWTELVLDAKVNVEELDYIMDLKGDTKCHGILLSIMHCRFGDVPTSLTESELFKLAIITEEYQVTHLLRPWVATWVKPHKEYPCELPEYGIHGCIKEIQNRLRIAWVFGEKDVFRELTELLVKEVIVNEESRLFIADIAPLEMPEMPGLLDYLKREHLDTVLKLHGVFDKATKNHHNYCYGNRDDNCECSYDKKNFCGQFCLVQRIPKMEQNICNYIVMGSIIRGYQQYRSKSSRGGQARQSINHVFRQLLRIGIYNYGIKIPSDESEFDDAEDNGMHRNCNPGPRMRSELSGIMSGVAKDLDGGLLQHLDRQAKLTGLDDQETKDSKANK